MKKTAILAAGAILAASASVGTAAPDNKPVNAATTNSGTSCIVHEGEGAAYATDEDCEWKTVVKRDRSGALSFYHYQDKGTLQEGQTPPDKAVKVELEGFVVGGMPCVGTEVISPSGNYASNLKCSN